MIDVAKQAGFTLDESRALLHADADSSAHAELRDLADRKLPEIDALIACAQAMRDWLLTARAACSLSSRRRAARGCRWAVPLACC